MSDSLVDETLDEHRGCMKLVTEVEDCLDRKPSDPGKWLAEIRVKLTGLEDALRRHFAGEEEGPIFRQLPTRHPRLAGSLAELEAEHPEMLADLAAVLQRAAELRDPEVFDVRELNARVQLFVARIRRHEAAENELVTRAYWEEVGVGD